MQFSLSVSFHLLLRFALLCIALLPFFPFLFSLLLEVSELEKEGRKEQVLHSVYKPVEHTRPQRDRESGEEGF